MIKVIKTLIYGVKPSGNQAGRAIRQTAEKNRDEYPTAYDIVQNDMWMIAYLGQPLKRRGFWPQELMLCLEKGGFTLKGFPVRVKIPTTSLVLTINLFGGGGGGGGRMKWYPKDDVIMFNFGDLNFSRKIQGRKSNSGLGIPKDLTMRL